MTLTVRVPVHYISTGLDLLRTSHVTLPAAPFPIEFGNREVTAPTGPTIRDKSFTLRDDPLLRGADRYWGRR